MSDYSIAMNTIIRQFTSIDFNEICQMMICLYKEDPGPKNMTKKKAFNTLNVLFKDPSRGTILVVESENIIVGYAILINFWSNEFGGNIINIDELYIIREFRSQGIATRLINLLAKSGFASAVNIQLEVTPGNNRARKLYERLGFKLHKNATYGLELNVDQE